MQCRNPKAVASMMKTITEAGESVYLLKFDGKLKPVNKNDKELYNESWRIWSAEFILY